MRFFIKNRDAIKADAWVEDWCSESNEWEVVCKSKIIKMGPKFLVDTLDTPPRFRKKGYASFLVKELLKLGPVEPIAVTANGKGFWDKLGMEDALGPDPDMAEL